MKETIVIDANVVIRFLLNDHVVLSPKAKIIFQKAQQGNIRIFLDEVIFAEIIWTLSSYYKIKKKDLVNQLEKLISQDWVINPRKKLIISTLNLYGTHNIDYIDCWIYSVSKSKGIKLETFDEDFKKLE